MTNSHSILGMCRSFTAALFIAVSQLPSAVNAAEPEETLQPVLDPTLAAPADELSQQMQSLSAEVQRLRSIVDSQTTHGPEVFDDRLDRLESAWGNTESQLKSLLKKVDPPDTTFEVGGRIHLDYWGFPNDSEGIGYFEHPSAADPQFGIGPENRFAFRRIRLESEGTILQNGIWRIQYDFAEPSEAAIKDVYGGVTNLFWNQTLIIGHHKRPIGLDALNSSRYNVFIERPFINDAFNEDARRLGISMTGGNDDHSFNWQYGIYELEQVTLDGAGIGNSMQLSGNARLWSSPWYECDGRNYLHTAISGMWAKPDGDADATDTNANEGRFRTRPEARSDSRWLDTRPIAGADWFETLGLETIYNVGPLQIAGEYMFNWVQRNAGRAGTGPDVHFHGAYVYASYFLTGEHMPYSRKSGQLDRIKPFRNFFMADLDDPNSGWGAWQVACRYSYIDLSDADILGGVGESTTLAVNWWWNPYAHVQFNLIYGEIEDHAPVAGFTSGHYLIAGTRFAVDF